VYFRPDVNQADGWTGSSKVENIDLRASMCGLQIAQPPIHLRKDANQRKRQQLVLLSRQSSVVEAKLCPRPLDSKILCFLGAILKRMWPCCVTPPDTWHSNSPTPAKGAEEREQVLTKMEEADFKVVDKCLSVSSVVSIKGNRALLE